MGRETFNKGKRPPFIAYLNKTYAQQDLLA